MDCEYSCGTYCDCTAGDCAAGETCMSGTCVPDGSGGGTDPGAGPGPATGVSCPSVPARDCTGSASFCGALTTFSPRTNDARDDYPINGETSSNQYRSYLRRDLIMLVDYASEVVACKAAAWDSGIGGPLGLGDMSEADGAVPGTSIGSPGHPSSTHTDGFDIDLAYYQTGTSDNRLRPICEYADNHCTAPPHLLDVWRSALFLGEVFSSGRTRVVGVDGQAGPILLAAIEQLCTDGWLSEYACDNISLAYEETDMGLGWFRFHLHHMHISLTGLSGAAADELPCKTTACPGHRLKPHPRRISY